MKRRIGHRVWVAAGVAAGAALVGGGCGLLGNLVMFDRTVTVELVNETGFTTDVRLYYGDNQNAFELELTTFGEELTANLAASGVAASRSFIQPCDGVKCALGRNGSSISIFPWLSRRFDATAFTATTRTTSSKRSTSASRPWK